MFRNPRTATGAFEVDISILTSNIKFWVPPAKLPIAYVALPFETLFECLEPANVLTVWYALVLEHKVLLVSSQHSILTVCTEILCSLLFPMQWSHLYIPLLPRFLAPMLDAPVPYLVGVARENWIFAEQNLSAETIVVDLDTNEVTMGVHTEEFPPVPNKKWNKLKQAVEENGGEAFWKTRGLEQEYRQMQRGQISLRHLNKLRDNQGSVSWKERLRGYDDAFNLAYAPDSLHISFAEGGSEQKELSKWERVQEAFLRFFVSTFKSYRRFLHTSDTNGSTSASTPQFVSPPGKRWSSRKTFDRDGYVAWQKHDHQPFYNGICLTQQFDDFITKRMYSPGEPDVIFFDQSIDAKLNRSKLKIKKVDTPFLQSARTNKVLKTIRAIEPNVNDLPHQSDASATESPQRPKRTFTYPAWPESFDSELFGRPRPIPPIITAEFDRQSSLVLRLRQNYSEDMLKEDELAEFYGADYNSSPEVATFTVFFFAYGAVVGLEWETFQQAKILENSFVNDDPALMFDPEEPTDELLPPPESREPDATGTADAPYDEGPSTKSATQAGTPANARNDESSSSSFLNTLGCVGGTNTSNSANANKIDKDDKVNVDEKKVGEDSPTTSTSLGINCAISSPPDCRQSIKDCQVCPGGKQVSPSEFVVHWSPLPFTGTSMASGRGPVNGDQSKNSSAPGQHNNHHRSSSLLDFDEAQAEHEELKEVAEAQLDLAFEALSTMTMRELPTDADAFKSLMAACGRCGNTTRAVQLIEIMKRDGFVADREIYSCFLAAFSHTDIVPTPGRDSTMQVKSPRLSRRDSDAYSTFLTNQWNQAKKADNAATPGSVVSSKNFMNASFLSSDDDADSTGYPDSVGSGGSRQLDTTIMSDIYNAVFTPLKKQQQQQHGSQSVIVSTTQRKRKKFRKKRLALSPVQKIQMPVTPRVLKQVLLGESLLDYLYSDLTVDTNGEACPSCAATLSEDDIVAGWQPCEFRDYHTTCPTCNHKFVPHFIVKSSSPSFVGSQGLGTPLYCEYLSPWVLRKELDHIINDGEGVQSMLSPEFRSGTDIRATLWWNLVVAFNRYRLPVSFLLQGSFQNPLIHPTPDLH